MLAVSCQLSNKPETHAPPARTQDMASMKLVEVDGDGRCASAAHAKPSQASPAIPLAVFPTTFRANFQTIFPTD